MKRQIGRATVLFCMLLVAVIGANAQGMYWESSTSGTPAGGREAKMYYMPRMFKQVSVPDGDQMIVRLDKQVVYTVNAAEKTYSEVTFAELEAGMKKAGTKIDARMQELQKRLESMPPEQRKAMEQQLGGMLPGKGKDSKYDVTNTGEKKTITGHASTKFVVTRDGKEFMSIWAAKDIKGFDAMRRDFEEYGHRMASLNEYMGKGMVEAMKKIDGFPMQTDIGGTSSVVTKVEQRSSPASEFGVPAGYTKVKSKMFEGLDDKE